MGISGSEIFKILRGGGTHSCLQARVSQGVGSIALQVCRSSHLQNVRALCLLFPSSKSTSWQRSQPKVPMCSPSANCGRLTCLRKLSSSTD